jgi:hypothetical protein
MSTIEVNSIQPLSSGTTITLGANGKTLSIPSGCTISNSGTASGFGKLGQIQSTTLSSTLSFTSSTTSTFADISGLSVNITPTATSSKILIMFLLNIAVGGGSKHMRLVRDSTAISIGDAGSSNQIQSTISSRPTSSNYDLDISPLAGNFLDSPSTTSQVTYKIQATLGATYNNTIYINRSVSNSNNDFHPRPVSTITVMEVLA